MKNTGKELKNKIQILLFILLSGMAFLVESCYTTNNYKSLFIEVLQPSSQNFPVGDSVVAAKYNNSSFKMDSLNRIFVFNQRILYDTMNTDSLASIIYYDSFIRNLQERSYFDSVLNLGYDYPEIGVDSLQFYTDNELDSLQKLHSFNTLYALNQFRVNDILVILEMPQVVVIDIIVNALWTIYRSPPDSSYLIIHKDTVTYTIELNHFRELHYFHQDRKALIQEASNDLGENLSLLLMPHWHEVERIWYKSGNYLFRQANQYARRNEWLKAAEIWKKLTKNRNKNIAAKSMFNMALACEMESDFDAAIDWVTRSFYVYGQKNAVHALNCLDYLEILAFRKLQIRQLKHQLTKVDAIH